jgi:hypothetical protein
VSNKRKRRRSGYRPPSRSSAAVREAPKKAEPRQGLLGSIFGSATPSSMSVMPNYRTSIGRGFLLVGSTPALLLMPFAWTLVTWLALQAFGYIGSPLLLAQSMALAPLSVQSDYTASIVTFGQPAGLYVLLPMLILRGLLIAVLAGLVVEGLERGSVSLDGVRRGLAALPLVLSSVVLTLLAIVMLVNASLLGPGLGTLLQVILPAVALWVLGFMPFVAVDERPPLAVALTRSYYGARTPGGRQFLFSLLYLLFLTILAAFTPGTDITANPNLETWAYILAIDYVHMAFFAAYGYRWLVIAPGVTAPPPRRSR